MGVDINKYSDVLKDVIWSTSVQHGPATNVVADAFKKLGNNASEVALIKEIYKNRWSGGQQFSGSTQAVKDAVYNRFFGKNGELNTALSRLNNTNLA